VAEGVEDCQEDGHGKGHGHDEREAQKEDLSDHRPWKSLAHQSPELFGHLAYQHETSEGRQSEAKRCYELPEQVAIQ
jgi:hypothetical protein